MKKRFFAACLDAALVAVVYFATYNSLNIYGFEYSKLLAVINCYILTVTFPVFIWTGQSVGKRLMHIRAASMSENPDHKGMLLVRELCKAILFTNINFFTLVLLLGFPLINPKKQALHDLITRTLVVEV
jgi:uncharacterized RDD family membrane protein YckC